VLVAFALSSLLTAQRPHDAVETLIERSDWIGIVRVETRHALAGTRLELVELGVEQRFCGPDVARLFAYPSPRDASSVRNPLQLGASYVLFLEDWETTYATNVPEAALHLWLNGARLHAWRGFWEVDPREVRAPRGLWPCEEGPPDIVRAASGDRAPRAGVIPWLLRRVGHSTPSIRVVLLCSGPMGPLEFRIALDGSVEGNGASTARISGEQWERLWRMVEAAENLFPPQED
jgi:hypothetical protein